jgi:endonuclease/exonuclease/phosphatase family metal-dependent hydrolase
LEKRYLSLMKKFLLFIVITLSIGLHAQENLNLVFYNVLNFPQAPPSNRDQILSLLVDEMQPDLFMICELESENGGNDILNNSLNVSTNRFTAAPYVNNTSSGANLQQLLYYDQNKFELVETSIVANTVRDINRYKLKLRTEEELFLEVFIAHLKASQGEDNEAIRLTMVQEFTSFLETLDPNTPVILAGDLNLYRSTEPAYEELLDPSNNIVLVDPINTPGEWNSNPDFEAIHTQSTRTSSNDFDGFGAGGGLDSRFDFILMSKDLLENGGDVSYVEESYAAFGNNGNCYNNRLDDEDCDGLYSQATRNLLYQMSDHLPVIAQLETNATFLPPLSLEDIDKGFLSNTIVKDYLEITLLDAQPNGYISIYDQTGRLIMKQAIIGNKTTIPSVSLSVGVYYAVLNDPKVNPLKFIKIN